MSTDQTSQENPEGTPTHPIEIDKIFREDKRSDVILAEMTRILEQHGIKGYSVHSVRISIPPRPNPDICIPYIKRVEGDGWVLGCSYVTVS